VSKRIAIYSSPTDVRNYQNLEYLQVCKPFSRVTVGECVRDVDWFPWMRSDDPPTCAFITCCKDLPVLLWDGCDGSYRCSYCAYNRCDELSSPYSVRFSSFGDKIFCGFYRRLCIFDTQRPGRDFDEYFLSSGQGPQLKGIVSCIDHKMDEPYYIALGTFSGVVGLADFRVHQGGCFLQATMKAHHGGITTVRFVPGSSTLLVAGARKDDDIVVWDIRNTNKVMYRLSRKSDTNQRIGLDMDSSGKFLCSGGTDGLIRLWSLQSGRLLMSWYASRWSVSSVSWNPYSPFLASCSGQRCFPSNWNNAQKNQYVEQWNPLLGFDNLSNNSSSSSNNNNNNNRNEQEQDNLTNHPQATMEEDHFVYRNKIAALWYLDRETLSLL